jgi:cytochrome c oxidase subunit 1
MFGKMMNETLGKIHFWGTAIPVNFIFIPLFITGAMGQHRRIYNYENFPDLANNPLFWQLSHIATIATVVMLAFQVVFFINLFVSLRSGKKAPKNPWLANTLEWTTESPPPHGNWAELPRVYRGPYEYSVPGRKQDYWPQNEPA